MNPKELYYTEAHVWVSIENDNATLGITEYGVKNLGIIIDIELPEVEDELTQESIFAEIQGESADAELVAALDGTVAEINDDVLDDVSLVAEDPFGDGWLVQMKITDKSQLDDLLTVTEYSKLVQEDV